MYEISNIAFCNSLKSTCSRLLVLNILKKQAKFSEHKHPLGSLSTARTTGRRAVKHSMKVVNCDPLTYALFNLASLKIDIRFQSLFFDWLFRIFTITSPSRVSLSELTDKIWVFGWGATMWRHTICAEIVNWPKWYKVTTLKCSKGKTCCFLKLVIHKSNLAISQQFIHWHVVWPRCSIDFSQFP